MEDEIRYTLAPDSHGDETLWRYWGEADTRPEALADLTSTHAAVFRAAASVLAPDDAVNGLVEKAVKDAYYAARDNGGTMHTAAEDARDAVLAALRDHATGGGTDAS